MPVAGSLAALMKEWSPNSVTLSAVTHSKLRKVLDGTGTQVVTCMINRWTVKMNGVGEYIIIEVSQGGGSQFWGLLKSSDREASENREEEEFILEHNLRISIYPSSTPLTIPLPHDPVRPIEEALTKAQFLSPFLYQIHCIGPVGFEFAYIYSEGPPQQRTLQLAPFVGRTCVLVRMIIENGGIGPPQSRPPSAWANQIPVAG